MRKPLLLVSSLLAITLLGCQTPRVNNTGQLASAPLRQLGASQSSLVASQLSASDQVFLDDLSERSFRYFIEQAGEQSGLVLDRAQTQGSPSGERVASTAATGFGLTALCIGAERGWISKADARQRILKTLQFLVQQVPHEHGWMPHFIDQQTGARSWKSEYSSIDTALLMAGVLSAKGYFLMDREIANLADLLYERLDFQWMLNGHPGLLSHGWSPEHGFIPTRWDTYSEHMILQMLGLGAPKNPLPATAWKAWRRNDINYAGFHYLNSGPLFTHQFSQAWLDLRHQRDSVAPHTNFFTNSITATRAHHAFNQELATDFPGYSNLIWGITASDSAKGYVAWGGPPREDTIDGTVVPCAAAGSLMFTPELSVPALRAMQTRFGKQIYGRYGFADAFNPNTGWVNPDVIGIDIGITLLSAENLRSGNVWKWFMRNPEMTRAYQAAGLTTDTRR